ncbi:MAG TPA: penicillin-binding protein 2 [Acidobacteriaceae bacterium]|nr:penicillin-binding protein 2 [Acidobacteriaceae bacterium]
MSDFIRIFDKRKDSIPPYKLAVFQYGIVLILAVLIFGLWRLQVVGAQNYHALAEANRIRKVPILAARGQIFDRDGRLLVDNYPSVSCFLVREQGHDIKPDLSLIARGLHMTVDQINDIIRKYRGSPKFQPIPLKEDITPDEQEFIAAHADEMPELETIEEQRRLYPRDGFAANLIGYVGEVSEQMLDNDPRYAFDQPGDVVGRSGVEESYDSILRGQDGSRDVLVDSRGREVGVLGTEPSVPGKNLRLTIDLDLQRAAENAIGNRDGAIVALDPHTGEVLAMVSRPTFDPNQFSVHISREEWNKLITDPNHPLLNKAIQAMSPPGSTFKIVMTLAGLQEGIAQNLTVNCQGGATFYGHFYACDRHHGEVNIHNALPYSCDTYYYTLAVKLGIDTIAKYAHEAGIGQKTGIDLPNEIAGVMPSPQWAMRNFHRKWYAGETVSVGIGQGAVAVTPIQLARTIGGIASGGVFKRPHVVFPSELPKELRQAILDTYPGSGDKTIPISPANWQIITDDMANVTQSPIGTAYSSRLADIDFAGKTGTAQVVSHSFGANKVSSDVSQRANAWFVGVAPRRNPDIVVVVFWQHGGWGTDSAHMAAQVIQAFVDKQRRLDHNLVAQQPGQSAQKPDTQKPEKIDVGAVWSVPGDPGIFGGKPLVPASGKSKSGQPATPQLASTRAGHFYITFPPAPAAPPANPLATSASSTLAEVVH